MYIFLYGVVLTFLISVDEIPKYHIPLSYLLYLTLSVFINFLLLRLVTKYFIYLHIT